MDELQALVNQEGMTGRVRFVGQRLDVNRWLAAADLFCFSTDFEGFPNAILEAMSAGLPVVTTAFAGLDELTLGRDVAELVPPADDREMAERVLMLLENRDRCRQLGLAAKALVEERFTWGSLADQMSSLYRQLVAQGRSS